MSDQTAWEDRQHAVEVLLRALDGEGNPVGDFTESAAPLARELRPALVALAEMDPPAGEDQPDVRAIFDRILRALRAALDGDRLVRTGDRGAHSEAASPVAREIRNTLDDLAALPEKKGLTASERLAKRIAEANSAPRAS